MTANNSFILERYCVGMLQTNCYLLADADTRESAVIDPGGNSAEIAARIKQLHLNLAAILNTHAHFDHIMEAWSLKESVGGEIYLHRADEPLILDRTVGLGAVPSVLAGASAKTIDRWLKEGDKLELGCMEFDVLETPGHSPGHVSFHLPKQKVIFVGDTLFAGSIGRTDFPGGSFEQLIRSVREKIFPLDDATLVYPGHGPETTVGREKKTNPFFA